MFIGDLRMCHDEGTALPGPTTCFYGVLSPKRAEIEGSKVLSCYLGLSPC